MKSSASKKSKKSLRCFVSFCVADGNVEELSVLLQELRKLTRDNVEYLSSEELPLGETLAGHESELEHADVLIIIGTPEYRRRIEMRELEAACSGNSRSIYAATTIGRSAIPSSSFRSFGGEASRPHCLRNSNPRERSVDLSKFFTYGTDKGRRLSTQSSKAVAGTIRKIADRLLALQQATVAEERRKQSYIDFDIAYFKSV